MNHIRDFIKDNKNYFTLDSDSITKQNSSTLEDCCIAYAFVLLFYTVLTVAAGTSAFLTYMYYVFDVLHIMMCFIVFNRSEASKQSMKNTQLYCLAFEITVSLFFIAEGAFAFEDQPAIYVSLAIVLINILFIHSIRYVIFETLIYVCTFVILAGAFKTPEAFRNDIYIAVATFISALIGAFMITRLRQHEAALVRKLQYLSTTDLLTGLYNKDKMISVCKGLISNRTYDENYIFGIIDIDGFKSINDSFGHDCGDNALRVVGNALRECFDENALLGRFGGDEFIVMTKESESNIAPRAQKVLERIGAIELEDTKLQCSIGIAIAKPTDTFDILFSRADKELYKAKREGGNRFSL